MFCSSNYLTSCRCLNVKKEEIFFSCLSSTSNLWRHLKRQINKTAQSFNFTFISTVNFKYALICSIDIYTVDCSTWLVCAGWSCCRGCRGSWDGIGLASNEGICKRKVKPHEKSEREVKKYLSESIK